MVITFKKKEQSKKSFLPLLVDGNWGTWNSWTGCSVTCANGNQTRTRQCDNPEPEHGGHHCTSNGSKSKEAKECTELPCPSKKYITTIVQLQFDVFFPYFCNLITRFLIFCLVFSKGYITI